MADYSLLSGMVIGLEGAPNHKGMVLGSIFVKDFGILRCFFKSALMAPKQVLFAEVDIYGKFLSPTSFLAQKITILQTHFENLEAHHHLTYAERLVKKMREWVYDGVELDALLVVIERAVRHLANGYNGHIVLLKALYLVCKSEGYSIVAWQSQLSEEDRLLSQKVMATREDFEYDRLPALTQSLEYWMSHFIS